MGEIVLLHDSGGRANSRSNLHFKARTDIGETIENMISFLLITVIKDLDQIR